MQQESPYRKTQRFVSRAVRTSRGPAEDEHWDSSVPIPPPLQKPFELPEWFNAKIWGMYPAEADKGWTANEFLQNILLPKLCGHHFTQWFDHWGATKYGDEEWLIFEPYTLGSESLRALLKFCEHFDLGISVQAGSAHRPCQTLRVMLRPRGKWREDFLQHVEHYKEKAVASGVAGQPGSG